MMIKQVAAELKVEIAIAGRGRKPEYEQQP